MPIPAKSFGAFMHMYMYNPSPPSNPVQTAEVWLTRIHNANSDVITLYMYD